jgi:hypothetical protein
MPDVFVSYNREDLPIAQRVVDGLVHEGLNVWLDMELKAGENYDEITEERLRGAKAVVVLWSSRSVKSRWVRAEATIGQRKSTLVPAMIEECDRPVMFELIQTTDLSKWEGDLADPQLAQARQRYPRPHRCSAARSACSRKAASRSRSARAGSARRRQSRSRSARSISRRSVRSAWRRGDVAAGPRDCRGWRLLSVETTTGECAAGFVFQQCFFGCEDVASLRSAGAETPSLTAARLPTGLDNAGRTCAATPAAATPVKLMARLYRRSSARGFIPRMRRLPADAERQRRHLHDGRAR